MSRTRRSRKYALSFLISNLSLLRLLTDFCDVQYSHYQNEIPMQSKSSCFFTALPKFWLNTLKSSKKSPSGTTLWSYTSWWTRWWTLAILRQQKARYCKSEQYTHTWIHLFSYLRAKLKIYHPRITQTRDSSSSTNGCYKRRIMENRGHSLPKEWGVFGCDRKRQPLGVCLLIDLFSLMFINVTCNQIGKCERKRSPIWNPRCCQDEVLSLWDAWTTTGT